MQQLVGLIANIVYKVFVRCRKCCYAWVGSNDQFA